MLTVILWAVVLAIVILYFVAKFFAWVGGSIVNYLRVRTNRNRA